MIVIVDSGSTKSDWVILENNSTEVLRTSTMGFNPHFHDEQIISAAIKQNKDLVSNSEKIQTLYYYGAGCSSTVLNAIVEKALRSNFPKSQINVQHDLLAAAHSTYGGVPNITCILGTGSNSCFYDGHTIREASPSLGYVLGDEGSGAYFGKKLVAAYLYGKLPDTVAIEFENRYSTSLKEIISNVYSKPNANVYLAGFAKFISDFKDLSFFQEMLHNGMREFLEIHVRCYPEANNASVNFVGSIAHHFSEAIESAAHELGLTIGAIVQRPIDGLVKYHQNQLK